MASFMAPYSAQTYALMRIVTGFLFLWHGSQKVLGFPVGMPEGVPAFIIASMYSLEWMAAKSIARLAMKGAVGCFSTIFTVRSSTFSMEVSRSGMPMSLK